MRWSPRHSSILGFSSASSTYVIHLLDSHLTWKQSVQVCSILGRVRVHGYNLRPQTFYSIHNYRTNSLTSIESVSSTSTADPSLEELQSFIGDRQLAENALSAVQRQGGDLLLLRKLSNTESLFLRTIRDHQQYSHWFSEQYQPTEDGHWSECERDLHVRLIEETDPTVIAPSEQCVATVDRIIHRWKSESTPGKLFEILGHHREVSFSIDLPFVVLVCGEKDMGKSTFTRYLANRALDHVDSEFAVSYFDFDLGQCEFSVSGCLSYVHLHSPLFGPPCSRIRTHPKADRLLYYGLTSPQAAPVRYLEYIDQLRRMWNSDRQQQEPKRSIIVINTMGWGTGKLKTECYELWF